MDLIDFNDRALLLDFGNEFEQSTSNIILNFVQDILGQVSVGNYQATANKILLEFDSYQHLDFAKDYINSKKVDLEKFNQAVSTSTHWDVYACYEPPYSHNADILCDYFSKPMEEIAKLHSQKVLYVFPSGTHGAWRLGTTSVTGPPNLTTLNDQTPKGSIGWSGDLCNSYPLDNAWGGWPIVCRVANYDSLTLKPGDTVQFHPVTQEEFVKIDGNN